MTEFESTEASFITMIVDRLQNIEQKQDELVKENLSLKKRLGGLEAELDQRSPKLFLTPHSKYTQFNDGYRLSYEIFQEPKMWVPKKQGDQIFDHDYVPLDDEHWKAIMLPDAVWLQAGEVQPAGNKTRIQIGQPGQPLDLKTFVVEFEEKLRNPAHVGRILADEIEYARATGFPSLGEPFYGSFEGLALTSRTSLNPNDMELVVNY